MTTGQADPLLFIITVLFIFYTQARLISALQQERSASLMQIFLAGSDTKNDGSDRGRGTSRYHDDDDDDDDDDHDHRPHGARRVPSLELAR